MGIHETFGRNLRARCFAYRTIAEVCAGIGINRQQFNKYLAGQVLPSASTLRRICSFMKVSEEELFRPDGGDVPPATADLDTVAQRMSDLVEIVSTISGGKLKPDLVMRPGFYFAYIPVPGCDDQVMRSLVCIVQSDGLGWFKRSTKVPVGVAGAKSTMWGRHVGPIVSTHDTVYLLGVNQNSPSQVSLMAIDRNSNWGSEFESGLILTRIGAGEFAAQLCLERVAGPGKCPRRLIAMLGPVRLSCSSLENRIRLMIGGSRRRNGNHTFNARFDHFLTA